MSVVAIAHYYCALCCDLPLIFNCLDNWINFRMVKFDCRCNLSVITELNLEPHKKELMVQSQFYKLLDAKQKSTSNSLVHRFLETYDINNSCLKVKNEVISFSVNDISRITGLSETVEDFFEGKTFLETPSWYTELYERHGPKDQ